MGKKIHVNCFSLLNSKILDLLLSLFPVEFLIFFFFLVFSTWAMTVKPLLCGPFAKTFIFHANKYLFSCVNAPFLLVYWRKF